MVKEAEYPDLIKRSTFITVVCLLGFVGILLESINVLIQIMENYSNNPLPASYIVIAFTLVVLYFIGLLYVWKMKKWGLIFYTITRVIGFTTLLIMNPNNIKIQIIPIISIILFWTQYKKMS